MYNPSTAYVEKDGLVEDDSGTNTLVPEGARGVALKYKFLLISV